MQLPHFLLIDLDDTILDLSTSSNLAWKSISLIFAPKLSIDSEKLLLALTRSRDWYWSDTHRSQLGRKNLANAHYQIVNNAFQDLGLYNRHISGEIAEKYSILREKLITPIKGAEETLQIFYNQHIKMGLITNGSSKIQRSRINRFGLNRYFECLLIEEEFDIGKPNKLIFLEAMNLLGISKTNDVWMIGNDYEYDIKPAQELGIGTVWIFNKGQISSLDKAIKPTIIVRTISELLEI